LFRRSEAGKGPRAAGLGAMQETLSLQLLILLSVANGTPVVAERLFGGWFA